MLDPQVIDQVYVLMGQLKTRAQILRRLGQLGIDREQANQYWIAARDQAREDFDGDLENLRAVASVALVQAIQSATECERWDAVFKGYDLLFRAHGIGYNSSDMIRQLTREGYTVTFEQLEIPGIHAPQLRSATAENPGDSD